MEIIMQKTAKNERINTQFGIGDKFIYHGENVRINAILIESGGIFYQVIGDECTFWTTSSRLEKLEKVI